MLLFVRNIHYVAHNVQSNSVFPLELDNTNLFTTSASVVHFKEEETGFGQIEELMKRFEVSMKEKRGPR